MALEEKDHVGEVLFRIQDDGSWAAHQRRLHLILKGGEVIHVKEGPATPLKAEDVRAVLGEVIADLAAERDSHRARARSAEAERDEHRRARNHAHAERDQACQALGEAQAAHGERAAAMDAEIVRLRQAVEAANGEIDRLKVRVVEF